MNIYIFLTCDGYTFDLNSQNTKKLQVIGLHNGKTPKEAYLKYKYKQANKEKIFEYNNIIAVKFDGIIYSLSRNL